jgi:hypothetical protein
MSRHNDWRGPRKSVHSSDLVERSLGVGDPNSPSKAAGKAKARWSSINLTGGGGVVGTVLIYDLPHDLGQIPKLVTLKSYERANGPATITARGVRPEGWSHSHAFVEVTLLAGSLDGCRASFIVEGA